MVVAPFMAKRSQKGRGLELSYAQTNKWEKDWTKYWFYVATPGVVPRSGLKVRTFPFASTMTKMKPCCRVRPPTEVDGDRAACNESFAKACRFSSGRDIVEEMIVSKFWPLGKYRPEINLVKMKLPVFGSAEGEYVPCFKLQRTADETDVEFVEAVEKAAVLLLGEVSNKEYLSCRAIAGNMPRLNRVFEEMKVTYGERVVPEKVLKSAEVAAAQAAGTATAVHATVQAESRKRKGVESSKAPRKKAKSRRGSKVAASEEIVESVSGGSIGARRSAEANPSEVSVTRPDADLMTGVVGQEVIVSQPPPRVFHPIPNALSDDSSESSTAEEASAASSASSEEVPAEVRGRCSKAQIDELEVESEERSSQRSRGKAVVDAPLPVEELGFGAASDEALEG